MSADAWTTVGAIAAGPAVIALIKAWEKVSLKKHDGEHAECLKLVGQLTERIERAEATISTLLLRLVPPSSDQHDTDAPGAPAE